MALWHLEPFTPWQTQTQAEMMPSWHLNTGAVSVCHLNTGAVCVFGTLILLPCVFGTLTLVPCLFGTLLLVPCLFGTLILVPCLFGTLITVWCLFGTLIVVGRHLGGTRKLSDLALSVNGVTGQGKNRTQARKKSFSKAPQKVSI